MKIRLFFGVMMSALLVLFFDAGSRLAQAQANGETLVIENAAVLSMAGDQITEGQTLLIRDGVIQWMGDAGSAEIPEDAVRIEGPLFVIPGLAEMHAHIPPRMRGRQHMEDTLVLYLANGITTIRGMLGEPAHLELREQAARHEIVSPRIFTSGPSFNGNSVTSEEQGREMVRQQHLAGYDLLKFHPGLNVAFFDAVTEEANALGIEFSGHISHAVGLERSFASGKGSIDHLDRYMEFLAGNPAEREDPPIIYFGYDLAFDADPALMQQAARLTREAGVWNVPTNTLLENVFNPELTPELMLQWPGMEFISKPTAENWANFVRQTRESEVYDAEKARQFLALRLQLTRTLHLEGAALLLGADAPQIFNPPGFSLHRELELLTRAGLSPFEALETGTVNVAAYLGESEQAGRVAPGFRADLVLLRVNPLQHFPFGDQIGGVIREGHYFSRETLDELLDGIRERAGNGN
ncbi:MAG: amidohydrolase family protein [Candidatus Cyclonatronum sp.]|uniref:amidohydrolase family protein n=1 Tax=Cyclonatronum sp. TaxID=3024185 RepID=UPI0025BD334D|nr:amidohydrolase family protein [Cyclonatronum sp.]MCH8488249.1 amidohydrolase family protein [Cyclonatronum sp.]